MENDLLNLCDLYVFLTDLITYTLEMVGLKWSRPFTPTGCLQLFHPDQGDFTLRYRNCWDEQFRVRIRQHKLKDILDPTAIQIYVEQYAMQCFEKQPVGNIPKNFFIFSAFLVDLAIFCFRYDRQDLVNTALFCIGMIYDCYLKNIPNRVFWYGLKDIADETNRLAGRSSENQRI